jgi:hypothetical protein
MEWLGMDELPPRDGRQIFVARYNRDVLVEAPDERRPFWEYGVVWWREGFWRADTGAKYPDDTFHCWAEAPKAIR